MSFLRGEDTQESFPSRLCSSLRNAGISVIKEDTENEISIEPLRRMIEGSGFSIIIFSEQYASSRSFLEEVAKAMDFHRAQYDHLVLTIFYGVDPSDVGNQESNFEKQFQNLIQRISPTEDQVLRWRIALSEAGRMVKFVVPNSNSKNESENIENIVMHVRFMLGMKDRGAFTTNDHLVGVLSQVQEVIRMFHDHQSKDVVSIGIWGMGGIGKTSLARVIYECISARFDIQCFLANLRESWETDGEVYLQRRLISNICRAPDRRIDSIESGLLELKKIFSRKKVLFVLDDVNHLEQLNTLCASPEWFGEGSRIIITTRDLHLLQAFQVDHVYTMKLLSNIESTELFNRHAFKGESPEAFIELSREIVSFTEGLPLALRVVGDFLYGRSWPEWDGTCTRLTTCLDQGIYRGLKVSFDSLLKRAKEIFLNVVIHYIGEDVNDAIQKLDGPGCNASIGIRALVDRSLVTIDENNRLRVHNLLQHMGRQIISESAINELQNQGHTYEVFLSFRGEDTRATFTSHLYSALCNAGIVVFKDDVELPRGNHISMELLQAIGSSKIAIIIFSRGYAESKWCLEELSIIMEHHRSNDQVVLPVFYGVDPSEIRNQTSNFGEAFQNLMQRISPPDNQVDKWRTALLNAGGIAGFVVLGSRNESEDVKKVVENVCDILDKKDLFVADHPVGVDDRVQEMITTLQNNQSEDVIIVGFWGMGGIGKSTIAKAIYNKIGRNFNSRSYLPKIREVWDQANGPVSLQNQLLCEICKTTEMKINNIESGRITLKDRLGHNKALLVLDDVDKQDQLKYLAGSRDWFHPESKIIITTRDEHLLSVIEVDLVYRMKHLSKSESLELLSWHAFKEPSPGEEFNELSTSIVAYSGGLPLALEVLGSYLFQRKVSDWESVLEKLKEIPNNDIYKKLKISYDGLNEDTEKEIFLDISCFLIGMEKNDVTHILNDCGYFANIGISVLEERSLLTIDEKNRIGMHDLLRDMGREITREEFPKKVEKRTRLWSHKEAVNVLSKYTGKKVIDVEGLALKFSQIDGKDNFYTKAFQRMERHRLLCLGNVRLEGDYKYISRDLKWLYWHGFLLKCIPRNFYQENLVALELKGSNLRQVWEEPQVLKRLKILNLSYSTSLAQTPDFSKLPNLEKLILENCPSLSTIHHSIGYLGELLLLNLKDCTGLHSLPRSIYRLKKLKTLILSGCLKIDKLEEDIEQMDSLTALIADKTAITQVPFSLVRLKSIRYISLCGYQGLSREVFPSLTWSWMNPTNNVLSLMPTYGGMSSSILWNMLNSCIPSLSSIPDSLPNQQNRLLECGEEIQTQVNRGVTRMLESSYATNCTNISVSEDCLRYLLIQVGTTDQVIIPESISQGLTCKYPYGQTFKGVQDSAKFKVPQVNGCHLKGMYFVFYPFGGDLGNEASKFLVNLMIINYTKTTTLRYTRDTVTSFGEVEWKEIKSNLDANDQVEVIADFGNRFTMKETVVYLIYDESFDEQILGIDSSSSSAASITGES
ncbi:disease resistance protein TAO1-like isoform X2 [Prosopis cineraria]|nr:disease resistance protein TAO1-like isoform X2 [Prosopis cineraria]